MAEDRSTLRDVDWLEVFPALRLFWALRLAINFRALVLAAIALAGVAAGWRVLGELFADPNDDVLGAAIAKNDHWPWDPLYSPLSKDAESPSPSGYEGLADGWERSPVVLAWADISRPFRQIFELGGPQTYSFRQLMEILLAQIGRKRWLVPIPFPIAAVQGAILSLLPNPPLTRDQVKLLKRDNVVSGLFPGLTEPGVRPTALEPVIPTYLDRFRPGGWYSSARIHQGPSAG